MNKIVTITQYRLCNFHNFLHYKHLKAQEIILKEKLILFQECFKLYKSTLRTLDHLLQLGGNQRKKGEEDC